MEITQLLEMAAAILKRLRIPYAVTGGVAVTVWGRSRYTADIDIIIDVSPIKIKELIKNLLAVKGGYVNIDDKIDIYGLNQRRGFNFIHSDSGLKIDFIFRKDDDFFQSEIKRAVKKKFNKREIYFISPEDLILIKLQWHKESGSTRHLEDIESILKITKIDLEYIKKWAKKQSTLKIFEKLKIKN